MDEFLLLFIRPKHYIINCQVLMSEMKAVNAEPPSILIYSE